MIARIRKTVKLIVTIAFMSSLAFFGLSEASSYTIVNQVGDEGFMIGNQLENFVYGSISVEDPNHPGQGITIMDRNLGALEAGTGENSYGYYYQWGNNYGFKPWELYEITDENLNLVGVLPSMYYNKVFNTNWGNYAKKNNNLWGCVDNTNIARQGPCPDGWHIPSKDDWIRLIKIWVSDKDIEITELNNGKDIEINSGGLLFKNDFLLPNAGKLSIYENQTAYVTDNLQLDILTSDAYSNSVYFSVINKPSYSDKISTNVMVDMRNQLSVRCFKNEYSPERYKVTFHFGGVKGMVAEDSVGQNGKVNEPISIELTGIAIKRYDNSELTGNAFDFNSTISNNLDLYAEYSCSDENLCRRTVNFETNGGSSVSSVQTDENFKITTPWPPTKEGFVFMGWYEDEELGYKFDFSTEIVKDKTLYAKRGEPIVLTLNANGGIFGNGEEENFLKYGKVEKVKYSHTQNLTDSGSRTTVNYGNGTGNYGDYWNAYNIRGTDRPPSSNSWDSHVITIKGVENLTVDLYYNGQSTYYDWASVWKGRYPSYSASSNYNSSGYVTTAEGASDNYNKFGGYNYGTYTVNGNILTNMGYTRLIIPGDTVTFGFYSNGSSCGQGYGYYAVVKGESVEPSPDNDGIEEPTREGYEFLGWYEEGVAEYFDFSGKITEDTKLYANWRNDEQGNSYTATLLKGGDFNRRIKTIATGSLVNSSYTQDLLITKIKKAEWLPQGVELNSGNIISTTGSEVPVYAWYNNGILYYYTEAETIYMNEDSSYMFSYLNNLTSLDVSGWNTSNVTNMSYMFYNCYGLTSLDVSKRNTSNVTNMSYMFYNCYGLTSLDVSKRNTSNVTNMDHMFYYCSNLISLDVSGWNTSNVTNMDHMFYYCSNLRSLDVSGWNTSKVTNMSYMFYNCYGLTSLDVSKFDTSNVTSMSSMFSSCSSLTSLDVSSFDTSNVTSMSSMFSSCNNLTSLDVSKFDTSNVTSMSSMFSNCNNLTSLDVSKFDTSNVTNMSYMFYNCSKLVSLDVSKFDTSNVTSMSSMFSSCSSLTSLDVSSFDTSNVTSMSSMFSSCNNLISLDVSKFDTSKVTTMGSMFSNCSSLTNLDISNFDTRLVTETAYMFQNCSGLSTIYVGGKFKTRNVSSSYNMFYGDESIVGGNGTVYDSNKVDITYAKIDTGSTKGYFTQSGVMATGSEAYLLQGTSFNTTIKSLATGATVGGYSTEDTLIRKIERVTTIPAGVTTGSISASTSDIPVYARYNGGTIYYYSDAEIIHMNMNSSYMFANLKNLESVDFSGVDTSLIKDMQYMFVSCTSLTGLDLSNWDTKNVTNIQYMFAGCSSLLSLNLSNWDISGVTNGGYMFPGCSNLDTLIVDGWKFGDSAIYNWLDYSGIKKLSAKGWILPRNFAYRYSMFQGPQLEEVDVSYRDLSETETIYELFMNATFKRIIGINTWIGTNEKLKNMEFMFQCAYNLEEIDMSGMDFSKVTSIYEMFMQCSYKPPSQLKKINMSNIKFDSLESMGYFCQNCYNLEEVDLSNWNVDIPNTISYATSALFQNAYNLKKVNLHNFGKVTSTYSMFQNNYSLTGLDLSGVDTSNVKDMSYMFYGMSGINKLDLSVLDTSNVTNMSYMFYGMSGLNELNLSGWNTSNVTSMYGMFQGCSSLTGLDVNHFVTSGVIGMGGMFRDMGALEELDITNFDTSNVTNMTNMFLNSNNLKTIYVSDTFSTENVENSPDMFSGTISIVGGNGTVYDSDNIDATYARIDNEYQSGYFTDPDHFAIRFRDLSGDEIDTQWINIGGVATGLTKSNASFTYYTGGDKSHEYDLSKKLYAYTEVYVDMVCDMGYLLVDGECVESPLPACIIVKNPSDWTNSGVTLTITGVNISADGYSWDGSSYSNNNTMVVSSNGIYTGYVTNGAEDTSLCSVSVDNIDTIPPEATIIDSIINPKSGTQTVTLSCTDNIGIIQYYRGTNSNPGDGDFIALAESTTNFSKPETVTSAGYTLFCKDAAGNISNSAQKSYYTYEVHNMLNNLNQDEGTYNTTNYSESSTYSYIAPAGSTIVVTGVYTVPTYSSGDKYKGYTTSTSGTPSNSTTIEINSDAVYYFWFDRETRDVNIEINTGIQTVYYKVNEETEYTSTTTDTTVGVKAGSTIYLYPVTYPGYSYTAASSETPAEISDVVETEDYSPTGDLIMYSITYNLNGSGTITGQKNTYTVEDTFTLVEPTWTGYKFIGWTGSNGSTPQTGVTIPVGTVGTLSFTANWEILPAYIKMGDTFKNQIIALAGGSSSNIKYFIRTGLTESIKTDAGTVGIEIAGSTPIYARYDSDSQTVYYGSESPIIYLSGSAFQMFSYISNIVIVDTSGWNTSNVTRMDRMFMGDKKLEELDVSGWDTSKVQSMTNMFRECGKLAELDVSRWNVSNVETMNNLFSATPSLKKLDVSGWDTSKVTTMENMFNECYSLSGLDVSHFVTSGVTNMAGMFAGCRSLTGLDVSNFDTSKVTNMAGMFAGCNSLLKLDLSNFDTSNVTDMYRMFAGDKKLVELNLSGWNTSKVTDMGGMFREGYVLSGLDVGGWDTSIVTNMSELFYGCNNLVELDLSAWDTSNVTTMKNMFSECYSLSGLDVSHFVTSGVTDMAGMFGGCKSLTGLDVFDTSNVTDMSYMFAGCSLTELDVSHFDTSNVTDMRYMFSGCRKLKKLDMSNWNTSNVTKIANMFRECNEIKTIYASGDFAAGRDINNETVFYSAGKVVGGNGTKYSSSHITGSYAQIDTESQSGYFTDPNNFSVRYISGNELVATITGNKVGDSPYLKGDGIKYVYYSDIDRTIPYDSSMTLSGYTEVYVDWVDLEANIKVGSDFGNAIKSIVNSNLGNIEHFIRTGNITDEIKSSATEIQTNESETEIYVWYDSGTVYYYTDAKTIFLSGSAQGMFNGWSNVKTLDMSGWDTSSVTSMKSMFNGCRSLTTLNLDSFNTSNVTDMDEMFSACNSLKNLNLSNFNTSKVTRMQYMFNECRGLETLNLSGWNTSSVTTMYGMFNDCRSMEYLDVSSFNTSNVEYMQYMFGGCASLKELDLSGWNTSNVQNMSYMFLRCTELTGLNISNFNTSNVTSMKSMFNGCRSLTTLNLDSFNTSNVTDMDEMFSACNSLKNLDVSKFDTSKVTRMQYMFNECRKLETLDLSNWDTNSGTTMLNMFYGTNNLKTIYASNKFTTGSLTANNNMFSSASKLIGGNGTKYDSSKIDATYAQIDTEFQSGYFTDPSHFAVRFKDLSGNEIETQWISSGQTATGLEESTSISYIYYSDYVDSEHRTGFDISTPLNRYTEIYAELPDLSCKFTYTTVTANGVRGLRITGFSGEASEYCLTHFEIPSQINGSGVIEIQGFKNQLIVGELKIPSTIININTDAFNGTKFTSLDFSEANSLIKIDVRAFANMGSVQGNLTIPNSVTTINNSAFSATFTGEGNTLTMGTGINFIDWGAFKNNKFTGSLVFGDSITVIEWSSFEGNKFTHLDISNATNLRKIGGTAFKNMKSLEGKLVIPDSVTEIGGEAFNSAFNTGAENTLKLGTGLITLGGGAFMSNNFTGGLVLPSGLSGSIGYSTFAGNRFIGKLTIPKGVTDIQQRAFSESNFTELNFDEPISLTSIAQGVFYGNDLVEVIIPEGVQSIGQKAFQDNKLTKVVIPNSVTTVGNGYTFAGNDITELVIGTGITNLPQGFLHDNRGLLELTIPDSVLTIGWEAFRGANLIKLSLGSGIVDIATSAFQDNSISGELVLPDSLISMGHHAFYSAFDTTSINNSLVIGNGLIYLPENAFVEDNLKKITFGNSVVGISGGALSNQNPDLKSFLLPNSIENIKSGNGSYTGYVLKDPSIITNQSQIKLVRLYTYRFVNTGGEILATGYYQSGVVSDMTKLIPLGYYIDNEPIITGIDSLYEGDIPEGYELKWQGLPDDGIATEDLVITGGLVSMGCKFDYEIMIYNGITGVELKGFSGEASEYCLTHFEIPDTIDNVSVKKIRFNAFNGKNITGELIIPSSIIEIGGCSAFANNNFTKVTFADNSNLETIGCWSFANNNLEGKLRIPDSVVSIQDHAFSKAFNSGTENTLILGSSIQSIHSRAFENNGFTGNLVLPENLSGTLGNSAFEGNHFQGELIIPRFVTKIEGCSTFANNNFTKVTFADNSNLEFIGCRSFENNNLEGELRIPDSVVSIEDHAFSRAFNSGAENTLVLGSGIQSIREWAFENNGFTGSLILPENLSGILGNSAFEGNHFQGELVIPRFVTKIQGCSTFANNNFTKVTFADNSDLETIGCWSFANNNLEGELIIPESVVSIEDHAFSRAFNSGAENTLVLGSEIQTINGQAFEYNNFNKVYIPDSLTTIRGGSFYRGTGNNYTTGYVTTIKDIDYHSAYLDPVIRLYVYTFVDTGGNVLGTGYYQSGESIGDYVIPIEYYIGEAELSTGIDSLYKGDIPEGYTLKWNGLPVDGIATEDLVITGEVVSMDCQFTYQREGTGVAITGFSGTVYDYCLNHFEIPSQVDGLDVVGIGNEAFRYTTTNVKIDSNLIIPDSVTYIGPYAFDSAFTGEGHTLDLGTGLQKIYRNAFSNNNFTGNLILPELLGGSIEEQAFGNNNFNGLLTIPNDVTEIGPHAFRNNKFTSLTLGANVKTIRDRSFMDNQISGIIAFPNSVENIGERTFFSDTSKDVRNQISGIVLGTGIKNIGAAAFAYNNIQGELELPDGLISIGDGAFRNNKISGVIRIPDSVTIIQPQVFNTNQITGIIIGTGLKEIKHNVFAGNNISGGIIIPNHVESIGETSFTYNQIKSVVLPTSLTYLHGAAFCNNAQSPVSGYFIKEPTTTFSSNDCLSISRLYTYTFVDTGGNVLGTGYYQSGENIGDYVIPIEYYIGEAELSTGIDSLYKGDIPEGYTLKWNGLPVDGIATEDLVITGEVVSMDCQFTYQGEGTGVAITGFSGTVYDYCLNYFKIPNQINGLDVVKIRDNSFKGKGIKGLVVIPDTVVTIGSSSFESNQITGLILGNSVKTVGRYAFTNNQITGVINFPDSVEVIGEEAFYSNPSNENRNHISGVIFGSGLKSIWNRAFANNNISGNIYLPEGLTTLKEAAFYGNKISGVVTIPSTIITYENQIFTNNQITGFVISENFTGFGFNMFGYNQISGTLVMPDWVETIAEYAFTHNQIKTVILPSSLTNLHGAAFCNNIQSPVSGYFIKEPTTTFSSNDCLSISRLYTHTFVNTGGETLAIGYYQSGLEMNMTKVIPLDYYTDGGNIADYTEVNSLITCPYGYKSYFSPQIPDFGTATEDLIITGLCVEESYDIIFDAGSNGGEIENEIGILTGFITENVDFGDVIPLTGDGAKVASKTGYDFVGWTTVQGGTGDEVLNSITVTGSITLYAVFQRSASSFDVNFHGNGAELNLILQDYDTEPVESGVNLVKYRCNYPDLWNNDTFPGCSIRLPMVIRTGFNVIGFSPYSGDILSRITPGISTIFGNTAPGIGQLQDYDFYAISDKDVSVLFSGNRNKVLSGDTEYTEISKNCTIYNSATGCEIMAPEIVAHSDTLDIIGFSTGTDDHVNLWTGGESKIVSENAVYYAQTKADKTMVLDLLISAMSGAGVQSIGADSKSCDVTCYNGDMCSCGVQLPTIELRNGYKSGVWIQPRWSDFQKEPFERYYLAVDISLEAVATPITYSITYNYDLDVEVSSDLKSTYTIEDPDFVLGTGLFKTGYIFSGWDDDDDKLFEGVQQNVTIPQGTYGDLSFTAIFQTGKYFVKYHSNNPNDEEVSSIFTYDFSGTINQNEFIYTGYHFTGWSLASDSDIITYKGGEEVKNLTAINLGVIDLYAVWNPNEYAIRFVDLSGNYDPVVRSGDYQSVITDRDYPNWTKEGYTIHWDETIPEIMPLNGLTINAAWIANTGTQYLVYHQQEQLDGTYKTVYTYTGHGTTDTKVTPLVNSYSGFNSPISQEITIAGDGNTILTYQYSRKIITLSFNTVGGSTISDLTGKYGDEVNKPSNPTRNGYGFSGWNEEIADRFPAENKTYIAQWSLIDYDIDYHLNGGDDNNQNPRSYSVESSDINLIYPDKLGYTFLGWTGTDLTEITKDVTISSGSTGYREYTAKWKANEYEISFSNNGGLGTMENQTMVYDESEVLSDNTFTRAGYTFLGWNTNSGAVNPMYTGGESVSNLATNEGDVVDLYAIWQANPDTPYTVYYYLENTEDDNYSLESTDNTKFGTTDSEVLINTLEKEITGAQFEKASLVANPEGPQDLVDRFVIDGNGTAEVYLFYKRNVHTVTATAGEGVGLVTGGGTYKYGAEVALIPENINPCYTATGISLQMPDQDVQIILSGTIKTFTVTLQKDAHIASVSGDDTYNCGTEVTIVAIPLTGYEFKSWMSGDAQISTQSSYIFTLTGDVRYTATSNAMSGTRFTVRHWIKDINSTTYSQYGNDENKSGETDSTITLENEKISVPCGKYLEGKEDGFVKTTTTIKGDGTTVIDLYYDRNSYTVTTSADTGIQSVNISAPYQDNKYECGAEVVLSATLKTGYHFTTYSSEDVDSSTENPYIFTMPDRAVSIQAQSNANTYTVKFNANGGRGTMSSQIFTYNVAQELSDNLFTKTGYIFTGWSSDSGAIVPTYTNKQSVSNLATTGSITLYAVWTTQGTSTKYTVRHIKQGLSTREDDVIIEEILYAETNSEQTPEVNIYTGFNSPSVGSLVVLPDGIASIDYIYTRKDITLTLNNDNGTSNTIITGKYEANVQKPVLNPTKTGYTFTTWLPTIPDIFPAVSGAHIAQYSLDTYTITYHLNSGTNYVDNPESYTYLSGEITIKEPMREGYVFNGWQGTDIGGMSKNVVIPAHSVGHRIYTAVWGEDKNHNGIDDATEPHFTIKFLSGEHGDLVGKLVYESILSGLTLNDYDYIEPIKISSENYMFSGWNPEIKPMDKIVNDMTYTAVWGEDTNHNGENDEFETKYKVTVNYVYSRGGEATGSVSGMYLTGIEFNFVSPTITYYTPNSGTVSGRGIEQDQIFNVTYTPNNDTNHNGIADEEETHYKLTIHYVNGSGGKVYDDYIGNYVSGANYSVVSTPRTYYTIQTGGEVISGVMGSGDIEKTVVYMANNDANHNGIADEEETKPDSGGGSGGGSSGRGKRMPIIDNHGSADNTGTTIEEPIIEKDKDSSLKPQKSDIIYEGETELEQAYNFALKNGITTVPSVYKARLYGNLTRIQMAKMLSYYAINVLGQRPNTSRNMKFNDVSPELNAQYDNAVVLSYQLGIMGINMPNNNFRPNDEVTRAEFATALSRMLYNIEDGKGKVKYYEPHMAKLYNEGIITNTNPTMKEKRGYVMIMLMRSVK